MGPVSIMPAANAKKTLQSESTRVRDLVNDARMHWRLRTLEVEKFNQVCAAMDVIDDTIAAIHSYRVLDRHVDTGERYLLTYGVLEALYLQQTAAEHLCHGLGFDWKIGSDQKLMAIRETRHKATGHPTRKDRPDPANPTFHQISRMSMHHSGFDLLSYDGKGNAVIEQIDLDEMFELQEEKLRKVLERLADFLAERDSEHRGMFRSRRLAGPLEVVNGYIWEKLGEGMNGSGVPSLAAARTVKHALSSFADLLTERGLAISTYSPVEHHFGNVQDALAELTSYYEGSRTGRVVDHQGVRIYCYYVIGEFRKLEELVREIDEEYAQ
jgi:hypothetical protein